MWAREQLGSRHYIPRHQRSCRNLIGSHRKATDFSKTLEFTVAPTVFLATSPTDSLAACAIIYLDNIPQPLKMAASMISFAGKVAIVTEAGGGLGHAHALELARRAAALAA
jgi:hypothetical protein